MRDSLASNVPPTWLRSFSRERVFVALELKPEDRPAFLGRVCSSDNSLRREVERLLSSSDEARSSFLESSALRMTLMPGTKLGDYEKMRFLATLHGGDLGGGLLDRPVSC